MNVIVHGGAGKVPEEPESRQAVLANAAEAGADRETVLDAVETAVRMLESAPRFNAGVGSGVQSDGVIRTDAGIITHDRAAGAACSMPGVEHAVSVARIVLEATPHVLVSAANAVELAAAYGIETDVDLWTERTRDRWDEMKPPDEGSDVHEQLAWVRERFGGTDTVGAVAVDDAAVAAATSTGGRWCALAGRVSDVPQIGSGFYASPAGGASATGAGEDIARTTVTRRAVDHLEAGHDAQAAADHTIAEFAERTESRAGVIVLDADGSAGSAYNSDAMQTAVVEATNE